MMQLKLTPFTLLAFVSGGAIVIAALARQSNNPPRNSVPEAKQEAVRPLDLELDNWTYPGLRTGSENQETVRFLDWAKSKWIHFCRVDLNKAGESIIVTTDICWPVTDDEIRVIARLSTLHTFRFRPDVATDTALDYLAANLRIKKLHLLGKKHNFTADGLAAFRRKRPDVQVNL